MNSNIEWIDNNQPRFIEISDKIWKFAELGLFEYKSSDLLIDILEQEGFTIERGVASMPTAFIATFGTEKPVIALLGEYDALPGLSQDKNPQKQPIEKDMPGHGCGHNLFGVACLAAVLAIKEKIINKELAGTVKFYGCPAEENANGKGWMVKGGLFEDVDISLTWHPGDVNTVVSFNFQAIIDVLFKFQGRTAHAAADPFNGRSALDAVELMNVGCNYLREHIISDARLHYIITKGGKAPNIVPEEAEVWYFVRAPKFDQVNDLYRRVLKVANGAALMTETSFETMILGGASNMLPNETLEDLLHKKMTEINIPEYTEEEITFATEIRESFPENYFDNSLTVYPQEIRELSEQFREKPICDIVYPIFGRGITLGGSTDVGDVTWVTPTAQFVTACSTFGTPGHSWQMVANCGMSIGHKGMVYAAKVLASATEELMKNSELVKRVKQEFKERIGKTPYESLIPEGSSPPIEHFRQIYENT
ncbi:amidohydrolase [Candidatus Heimdallarchaeota archaeon B3_Heim]|nr:MAG: amidohydrolase [Candidatus Heimdallarchaeota archaeon B3_Heim]